MFLGSAGSSPCGWQRLAQAPVSGGATTKQFADGYAQAVTFGLLMARARDIPLSRWNRRRRPGTAADQLADRDCARLLTDDAVNQEAAEDFARHADARSGRGQLASISKDEPDAWLYFYEDFLAVYDNKLRKQTGSYYTPPEVVPRWSPRRRSLRAQAALRAVPPASRPLTSPWPIRRSGPAPSCLACCEGSRRPSLTTRAPARCRGAIAGGGNARDRLRASVRPFRRGAAPDHRRDASADEDARRAMPTIPELELFVTDTLGNPFVEEEWIYRHSVQACRRSRGATPTTSSKAEPITVVIGNPPYKEKARAAAVGSKRGAGAELLHRSTAGSRRREWGVGAHVKHLRNLYVYFWRWATWKVFGSGELDATTGCPDNDEEGIVCFITVAGFLNGPGFEKMRDDLRRDADRKSGSSTARPKGTSRRWRRAYSRAFSSRSASSSRPASSARTPTSRREFASTHCRKAGARLSSRRSPR